MSRFSIKWRSGVHVQARWAALMAVCVGGVFFNRPASAQVPFEWKLPVVAVQAEGFINRQPLRPGDEFLIAVRIHIESGWHLYANPKGPADFGQDLMLTIEERPNFLFGEWKAPPPQRYDLEPELVELLALPKEQAWNWVFFDEATFYLPGRVKEITPPGSNELTIRLRGQACEKQCISFDGTATIPIEIAPPGAESKPLHPDIFEGAEGSEPGGEGAADAAEPEDRAAVEVTAAGVSAESSDAAGSLGSAPEEEKTRSGRTLWPYLLMCFGLGLGASLTPCFYPMIPVTVGFFLKQGQRQGRQPLLLASIYSLTIVASFTAAGLILQETLFRLGSIPVLHLVFAMLLLVFGLSLIGLFDIPVPQRLARWTSQGEAQGGYVGVMFMALTLLVVGTPCIAPFWGPVLAGGSELGATMFGTLSFSLALAIPFFVLALIPGVLGQLPKSGGWMTTIKVVMGFVLLGFSLIYFVKADQGWQFGILSRNAVLSIWAAMALVAGLYLLGLLRTDHDTPAEGISGLRMLIGTLFVAGALYLSSGLIQPLHSQIEAPLPDGGIALIHRPGGESGQELSFPELTFEEAVARAKEENRPVFLDFTGQSCTNCKIIERGVFPQPEVRSRLEKLVRAKLYIDRGTKQDNQNQQLLWERFRVPGVPFYAVVGPDGEVLSTLAPQGTQIEGEFIRFLDEAFSRWDQKSGGSIQTAGVTKPLQG